MQTKKKSADAAENTLMKSSVSQIRSVKTSIVMWWVINMKPQLAPTGGGGERSINISCISDTPVKALDS